MSENNIPSNKNALVEQIYNLSKTISFLRVGINFRKKVSEQLEEGIGEINNRIVDNPDQEKVVREQNKTLTFEMKKLEEDKTKNDEELEELTEDLKNKEHLFEMTQEELTRAEEYEIPVSIK